MANKMTKRALLSSVTALFVCFTMLVGTTFAWFTDSVTSSNNVITTGNLDIALDYQNKETSDWTEVNADTNVFMKNTLWEPGHVEVVDLRITNKGSLDLKYQLSVNVANEVGSINVNGVEFKISDFIKFGVVDMFDPATGKDAIAGVEAGAVAVKDGHFMAGTLTHGAEKTLTMVVYMPESVGNEANHKTGEAAPSIDLGINLVATQMASEEDSFGPNYDENAWAEGMQVHTAQDLQSALALGGSVKLMADITSDGTSIVVPAGVTATLDLNGKTISGVNNQAGGAILVNEGTLVIKNGTVSSTVKNGPSAILNKGSLEIIDATIIGASKEGDANPSYAVNTQGAGSTLKTTNTNISGRGAIGATNGAKVTVNSGTYHTPEIAWGHAIYASGEGVEVVINGGTFTEGYEYANDNWGMYQIYAGAGAKVTVNGGDFSQEWDCANGYDLATAGDGQIVIKGGTFADDPSNQNGKNFVADGYEVVVNADGTHTVSLNLDDIHTADTLASALAMGGNITITADIATEETLAIAEGVTANVNLNGKTITGSTHKDVGAVINNKGTLTITGGTISSTGDNGGAAIVNSGTLTLEDATLNGAPNANGSWPSYTFNNSGVATATNVKFTSYHGAVSSYGTGALVTLNDCEIDMAGIPGFTNHGVYTYSDGAVVINGGTYVNHAADQNSTGGSVLNGNVTVNGGTFSGRLENYYGTPVLNAGTFSVKPNSAFVGAGKVALDNGNGTWTVADQVNNAADLVTALNAGGTVALGADVVLSERIYITGSEPVTLNLNGKNITTNEASGYAISNYGNLTIEGSGTVTGVVFNGAGATTTINGGTFNPVSASSNYVILNNSGKLEINNAIINAGAYYAVFSYNANNELIINNATINATFGCVNAYGENSKVTINGGTYNMTGVTGTSSHIAYFSSKCNVTINGGSFNKVAGVNMSGTGGGGVCVNGGATLTVKGGNFAGDYADVYNWGDSSTTFVLEGGTFKHEPSAAHVAAGKTVTANGDGTWTIA